MKATINGKQFADALNKVRRVVSTKGTMPILSHVLIVARDDSTGITISATDLKMHASVSTDCTIDELGSITANAQRLGSLLAALPDEDVTIESGENNIITVSCGKSSTQLFSLDAGEFPQGSTVDGVSISIKQNVLKLLLQKTMYAVCVDVARANLCGVRLSVSDGKLFATATDGKRFALASCEWQDIAQLDMILPTKAVAEIERLLDGNDDSDSIAKASWDAARITFMIDDVIVSSSRIAGKFPDHKMVMGGINAPLKPIMRTKDFQELIRLAQSIITDSHFALTLSVSGGRLSAHSSIMDVGKHSDSMGIDYDGEDTSIAISTPILASVARKIDTEYMCIAIKDALSPCFIGPVVDGRIDDSQITLVMPIRM